MKITVIGTGYLGAVHAAGMAALGHDVLGVDSDSAKISALQRGDAPFFEPGLPQLLENTVSSGALRFTTSIQEAAEFGDVHFICVGTPQTPGTDLADLRFVDTVVRELASSLTRACLIVGKSTVPVGTARRLQSLINQIIPANIAVGLAWNPEFLREGFAVEDTLNPDRLVFGVDGAGAEAVLHDVYRPILGRGTPHFSTDLETAELVKVAANSFLAMKISFINAMAEVCETVGADVVTLADAIGKDTRIGRRFLNAGVGFGGGCLGKDIRAFHARGQELGLGDALDFLRTTDAVNNRRRQRVVDLAEIILDGNVAKRRITILGASFKPNSDDVRDSPALHVAKELHKLGALVTVHDPAAIENARRAAPALRYSDSILAAVTDAELVVHLTEWADYQALEPSILNSRVAAKNIIDARNALEVDSWNSAGWNFHSLGRPLSPAWATTSITEAVFPEAEKAAVA